ncbi:MAG TPA: alpha/beta fold hydrolase, partial [Rhodothermales bacterium]|nr:alpha/beta fold hydrolase [Rhodothermales bacterium]
LRLPQLLVAVSLNALLHSPWPVRIGCVVAGLGAAAFVALFGATAYFTHRIRTHPVVTFEEARTDPAQVREFGLGGRYDPAAWGLPLRAETYRSAPDGVRLEAWFVPPTDTTVTDCAVVFVHGRRDNRLKALKYLPLLRQSGAIARCAAFFPDLRGSGTSEGGASDMGWQHAEDLTSTLEHLARVHSTRRFLIYAFSMGATSTAAMLNRAELRDRLRLGVVQIDRIVMDSPLANAEAVVRLNGRRMGLPSPLVNGALFSFRFFADTEALRLGPFLRRAAVPVLVLHGLRDRATPYALVEAERPFSGRVRVVTLPEGDHVKLVNDPETASRYAAQVVPFLSAWVRDLRRTDAREAAWKADFEARRPTVRLHRERVDGR